MDSDGDNDARVQKTKSQIEAALGAQFETLIQKMLLHVRYFVFSVTFSTSSMLGLLQQIKSRFKSGGSSNWKDSQH